MSAPNKSYDPVEVEALKPEEIERMRDEAFAAFAAAGDLDALAQAKTAHTGGTSPLSLANREIGALPPQAKAEAGKRVGQARGAVSKALAARQAELEAERDARVLVEEAVDVTLPYDRVPAGARHPLTTLMERVADVFVAMGYEVAEGPEVEAEWFNFDALNFVPDHPARQMQDTFFVRGTTADGKATEGDESGVVLRTHTSPVQARSLLERTPPVYVVCPGRVYRTDELDATHTPVFHQIELLAIDEGLTMADLKGTLDHMVQALFGPDMKTRLRPNFFPFTEPSAEMDMVCYVCRGESVGNPDRRCRTCGSEGWIELGGCGMVNPKVLVACGVDPQKYSGFAFGFGIDLRAPASRRLVGQGHPATWADAVEAARSIAAEAGVEVTVRADQHAPWHPGRCAALYVTVNGEETLFGHAGELHPRVIKALHLPERTCAAEVELDVLERAVDGALQAPRISTFPVATQDVALVVAEDVPAADVERALREGAGELLESLRLFDVFTGEQIGGGNKSLAYALRFRAADRTLTVEEASAARDSAVALAAERTGAVLRGA
ncbi:hypothetical protein SCALM49S_09896 [Streptomyces californicus]